MNLMELKARQECSSDKLKQHMQKAIESVSSIAEAVELFTQYHTVAFEHDDGRKGRLIALPFQLYIDAYDGTEAYVFSMTTSDESKELCAVSIVYKLDEACPVANTLRGSQGDERKLVDKWIESLPLDIKENIGDSIRSSARLIYRRKSAAD